MHLKLIYSKNSQIVSDVVQCPPESKSDEDKVVPTFNQLYKPHLENNPFTILAACDDGTTTFTHRRPAIEELSKDGGNYVATNTLLKQINYILPIESPDILTPEKITRFAPLYVLSPSPILTNPTKKLINEIQLVANTIEKGYN